MRRIASGPRAQPMHNALTGDIVQRVSATLAVPSLRQPFGEEAYTAFTQVPAKLALVSIYGVEPVDDTTCQIPHMVTTVSSWPSMGTHTCTSGLKKDVPVTKQVSTLSPMRPYLLGATMVMTIGTLKILVT